ncbi:hypothetical protein V8F20_011696 [Naviculisporaceae sp. PSN 640]
MSTTKLTALTNFSALSTESTQSPRGPMSQSSGQTYSSRANIHSRPVHTGELSQPASLMDPVRCSSNHVPREPALTNLARLFTVSTFSNIQNSRSTVRPQTLKPSPMPSYLEFEPGGKPPVSVMGNPESATDGLLSPDLDPRWSFFQTQLCPQRTQKESANMWIVRAIVSGHPQYIVGDNSIGALGSNPQYSTEITRYMTAIQSVEH